MLETAANPEHGGDGAEVLQSCFPHAPKPWLDLSTGICPWSYPYGSISHLSAAALPSPSLLEACRKAAAHCFGVPASNLAVLPGSQAAISLLPRLFTGRHVAIAEPTYGEHAHAWGLGGHSVAETDDPHGAAADILILANPNNPDGRLYGRDEILAIVAQRSRDDKWTIVDEAFIDLVPRESVAGADGKLIVFRSFGKFFGLAGLRLGFTIASEDIVRRLEQAIGPWAVSGAALEVGARAYADRDWQDANRRRLHVAMTRQRRLLSGAGLHELGGTDLFALYQHPASTDLFRHLCEQGIYVRRFEKRPDRLRFGLVPDDAALARLEKAFGLRAAMP